jgi:zinc protease
MNATHARRGTLAGLVVAAALMSLATASGNPGGAWKNPRDLAYPPLNPIRTPQIEKRVLANGLTVFVLENHDFPVVDYQVLVRAGSIYEPAGKKGLAAITGTVLRTGGTTTIAGDDLDLKLESMGASLEANIGDTQGTVTGSFLSQNAAEGLTLLYDLVRNPAFTPEKIELAKVDARTEISSRNDEAIQIAIREFRKLMYGADSPYGWYPEYADIAAITRADLVAFHEAFFHPNRMFLTVYGDFDTAAMLAEIERAFGAWPADQRALPPDPPVSEQTPQGVFYALKTGVNQSTVLFGLVGTLNSDPDYAALQLLNKVLGDGFSSRLVNEIRTRRGLAYDVGSAPGTGWHHPGVWMCYLMTQSDSTVTATRAMRAEVERITREPVSAKELELAREIALNELVFDLSSQRDVLRRKALYAYYGYPEDFLERYQQKVRTLTAQDLLTAAQRRIDPAAIATVIVGVADDFAEPITTLGPVTELDITIPEPASTFAAPEPTPETLAQGQRILDAAAAAHGGSALAAVRSERFQGSGSLTMMGNAMTFTTDELKVFPDRNWRKMSIGGFVEIVTAVDGASGWSQSPQGVQDLSTEEVDAVHEDMLREPDYFLTHRAEMKWQALAPREFDGLRCDVVYARETVVQDWVLYFDAATHRLAGMEYRGQGPMGAPAQTRVSYGDYRTIAGVAYPHAQRVQLDGKDFMSVQASKIEVNGAVDAALFKKP